MMTTIDMIRSAALIVLATSYCLGPTLAQTPAPLPNKAPSPARIPSPVTTQERVAAPQVVTIVHRLNGLKMFRLLIRSEFEAQAVTGLDESFNLMEDVHTNVIAGLTMDDGHTIAVWLPEAEVEFGLPTTLFPSIRAPLPPKAVPAHPGMTSPRAVPSDRVVRSLFDGPDLTVIGSDGKRLAAQYVGFDGITGLSILRLRGKNLSAAGVVTDQPVGVGENVRLFGPEPVASTRLVPGGSLYARMAAKRGTILSIARGPFGKLARLKVRSPRLSLANIGGVALNDAGETLGIVDGIDGSEASILPTALIQGAANRVLAQQSSVPKPWLGVKGEPIATLNVEQIQNQGWDFDRATRLAEAHRGILLTSIMPGSPAALAALRAGDVILKVNDQEIQNAEIFSALLEQAGPSSSVRFTLARPGRPLEEAVSVKLSGLLDSAFSFGFPTRAYTAKGFSLIDQGIETIALRPAVAARLGATAGLLIVHVEPATAAFNAGLQPGDVIQSIDGKPVPIFSQPMALPFLPGTTYNFEIVREKQKLFVTVVNPEKKR